MENLIQHKGEVWQRIYSAMNFCRIHGHTRFIALLPDGENDISKMIKVCEKCKEEDDLHEEVRD